MSIFDALRRVVPRFGSGGAHEMYEYRCRDCDGEFESPRRHVTDASCPACGSEDVRVRDDPYLGDG